MHDAQCQKICSFVMALGHYMREIGFKGTSPAESTL